MGATGLQWPTGPIRSKGRIVYQRALVVMACVLMTAAVITGAELGLTVRAATCPVPVELRVLTSQEDLAAIQAAIPAFEQVEPKYVGIGLLRRSADRLRSV